jgi:zinc protease
MTNNHPLLPYTEKKLPCGMTLIHKEVNVTPIIAIDIWVHTGAVHDPEPHYGLSHFFEHMFFKGTQQFGVGVMDRIITSLGGYNNASTSLDYTHYYVVLPKAGWEQAMDVMLDSIQNPIFDRDELERERTVIYEEIKRHEDNPWSKVYDQFTSAAFAKCPYSRQVLGTEESLATITRDTFMAYLQDRYAPENISLSVVGDISLREIEEKVNSIMKPGTVPFTPLDEKPYPVLEAGSDIVLRRDVNQSYVLLGFPTPEVIATPSEYALDILSMILGEGRSSRLHKRLNDDLGIVSSVSSSFWTLRKAGLFIVEAVTEPSKVKQVEQEIHAEIKKLRERSTEEELRKVKSMSKADYAFSNEKVISIANTYGQSRVMASIDHTVRYLDEIEKIQLDDLYRVFDTYILPETCCKGVLLPKTG